MWTLDLEKLTSLFQYRSDEPIVFNSGLFLFLFTGFILLYYLLKDKGRLRVLYVILFSFFFYYKSSGVYFLLLLFTSLSDYLIGRRIFETHRKNEKKIYLVFSILANLGILCYFKYTNLFWELWCDVANNPFSPWSIILPVGISFFTFQSLSYTIDIYRGHISPLKHFMDYAFFVSFFPQLVAGPIVRAKDFLPQLERPIVITREMFGRGIFLILIGLFKKAVISDYISINFVDRVFDSPELFTGIENLLAVYGYALQIYCDFSGYSDMAIGLALLLGYHFNINFDSPYQSKNITEFWHRWHISLSTWLRDYLYISMGGNRKGKIRTYLNLFLTMLLGGLWHGASLRFLFWGAWHGVLLIIHKLYRKAFPKKNNNPKTWIHRVGTVWSVFITFNLVCVGWVFFRASSFQNGIEIFRQIFTNFQPAVITQWMVGYSSVFTLMIIGYVLHFIPKQYEDKVCGLVTTSPLLLKVTYLACMIVFIMQIKSSEILPFIYFQF